MCPIYYLHLAYWEYIAAREAHDSGTLPVSPRTPLLPVDVGTDEPVNAGGPAADAVRAPSYRADALAHGRVDRSISVTVGGYGAPIVSGDLAPNLLRMETNFGGKIGEEVGDGAEEGIFVATPVLADAVRD
tara:strand:+ start:3129 stop:3521 length:393 start_codon:yes stop_codon:yes gene_type:complete